MARCNSFAVIILAIGKADCPAYPITLLINIIPYRVFFASRVSAIYLYAGNIPIHISECFLSPFFFDCVSQFFRFIYRHCIVDA